MLVDVFRVYSAGWTTTRILTADYILAHSLLFYFFFAAILPSRRRFYSYHHPGFNGMCDVYKCSRQIRTFHLADGSTFVDEVK